MASKIFDIQDWRVICDTEEDQTSATTMQILARNPKTDEVSTFDATLDSDVNRIYYDVAVDELTELGDWDIWPKTTIGGNIAPGDSAKVIIYAEGT